MSDEGSSTDTADPSRRTRLDRGAALLAMGKPELEAALATRRRNAALVPTPPDGATVDISPPGLAWSPVDGARSYGVEIRADGGGAVHRGVTRAPVHLPARVLPPGSYSWNVTAFDAQGAALSERGWHRFAVAEGVPELPWVEPEELLARLPARHPRFLYLREELPQLRASLTTTRARSWAGCLAAADRALSTSPPEYPTYHLITDGVEARLRYHDYHLGLRDTVEESMMALALAFLMTEDEQYAHSAKQILLAVTEWPTDDHDVTSVRAPWGDEPGLIIARSAHRAYDWLHDSFNEDERRRVHAMCEARASQALRRLLASDYLCFPGDSHGARIVAYLVEMAIVMPRATDAPEWLRYALEALTTFYPHWGGVDGGWAEGIVYGCDYGRIHLPAIETLRKSTGVDLWSRPFFANARHFFVFCTSPRAEFSPFGDGAERGGPGQGLTAAFGMLLRHHAHRFGDPHVGWWVEQMPHFEPRGEDALLVEDTVPIRAPSTLPNAKVFRDVGWAALHSDLTRPEVDTLMVFKSSPYGSVSHSHADQNSFAVLKGGAALAIPSGYYGPVAGMAHHEQWTCSTRANNTVLVDGEGQAVHDRRAAGRISAFHEDRDVSYVAGDATDAYAGRLVRFVRHILFVRPGLFLLLDVLEAPRRARFQWLLHTLEQMEVDHRAGRVTSRRSGARMDVHLRSPAGLRFTQTEDFAVAYNAGIPDAFHEPVANHWHFTAETEDIATTTRVGAVITVNGPRDELDLELLDHPSWMGAKASGSFGTAVGWIQLEAGSPGPDGYDAAMTAGRTLLGATTAAGTTFTVGDELSSMS